MGTCLQVPIFTRNQPLPGPNTWQSLGIRYQPGHMTPYLSDSAIGHMIWHVCGCPEADYCIFWDITPLFSGNHLPAGCYLGQVVGIRYPLGHMTLYPSDLINSHMTWVVCGCPEADFFSAENTTYDSAANWYWMMTIRGNLDCLGGIPSMSTGFGQRDPNRSGLWLSTNITGGTGFYRLFLTVHRSCWCLWARLGSDNYYVIHMSGISQQHATQTWYTMHPFNPGSYWVCFLTYWTRLISDD